MSKKHIAKKTHDANKIEWERSKTCEWLVEEGDFQAWSETKTSSSVLWVHGRRESSHRTTVDNMN
jgi:hypothetical protein